MKYAIILPDGAADFPLPQLDGRTPLEAARIPHMDAVAAAGQLGCAVTIPAGFTPGTDVGTLSLMGYDPHRFYSGRAPIEAAAKGLSARPDQMIFRCNLVTIEDGRMKDFTAGHITQPEADRIMADLGAAFGAEGCEFHPSVSYRNLLLLADAAAMELRCQPPHDIPDQPVADYWPHGTGAERVCGLMQRAAALLADHPVTRARRAEGRNAPTNIWLWGQGRPTALEPFAARHGVRGALITGVDILRGLAVGMGMELIHVPGATGYIDTDFDGKGRAAVRALDDHDLVVVHVEAADEAGHLGDAAEKVRALERIDEAIVGPLLAALRAHGPHRVFVAADHPTPVGTKTHDATPPPFCFAGSGIAPNGGTRYTEAEARRTGLLVDPGHGLMERFFRA